MEPEYVQFVPISTERRKALPDSAFAYVSPTGERKLPFRNKDGSVDKPRLRNALARLKQTDISPAAKAKALRKLKAAAKEVGIEVETELDESSCPDGSFKREFEEEPEGDVIISHTTFDMAIGDSEIITDDIKAKLRASGKPESGVE
jgi:hypothetical protein